MQLQNYKLHKVTVHAQCWGIKAALIRMNSLTAQLRSDHGKLISRLLFHVCTESSRFRNIQRRWDRFEKRNMSRWKNSINGFRRVHFSKSLGKWPFKRFLCLNMLEEVSHYYGQFMVIMIAVSSSSFFTLFSDSLWLLVRFFCIWFSTRCEIESLFCYSIPVENGN